MHFSVSLTSVITRHTPHAYSAFPEDMPAKQTKSVITLDSWFNRLWQHWKVANEIAFFICISVFTNKSNPEHACCTVPLNKMKLALQLLCIFRWDNPFSFRFCLYVNYVPKAKGVRFQVAWQLEEVGREEGVHIVPVSQREGQRTHLCQTTCQALMLQWAGELA